MPTFACLAIDEKKVVIMDNCNIQVVLSYAQERVMLRGVDGKELPGVNKIWHASGTATPIERL